ncbi:FAD-dependent monooxygenase [Paraburkholderia sp. CNPSo 3274]|uniref:FAD-dependent monooxygenase n=1 Tax=Paraburkholderia sp. CNPSo 3274 TaxID=2940932 RepID=UPI0020B6DECB|nr:FAD-dependent monooxygenase [Paraburkholderia sp. CNPSo 3274]MCP3705637.1 FAD-dependent monooxygenase [Paraburkholderia sp. CNPSo 3274]
MANANLPLIVVGGGLGGLSLALALGQNGRRVHVLEQAAQISPIGYGIQLGPNVFKAFDRLGLSETVKASADFPVSLSMPDADSGQTLVQVPLTSEKFYRRFKNPYIVIHRADIHNILLEACRRTPGVELIVNATAVNFEDRGSDGVRVTCADGRTFEGAALIGADGIKSKVREYVAAEEPARSVGYVAHRTMIDMKDVPADLPHQQDVVLWAGPGYHVVHYPLRNRTIFNIVAVFKDPAPGHGDLRITHEEDVKHVYANAHPALKKLLSMMDLERRWVLADRDPIRQWTRGRMTLLGDAVHPTLQSLAQGAGMAIEDAVCLADLLHGMDYDYERAFREYPRRRLVRSARVQLGSRELWEFYHVEGIAREVRDAGLKDRGEDDYYDCLEWIWKGDPSLVEA